MARQTGATKKTLKHIEYIRKNVNLMTFQEIADHLGISRDSVAGAVKNYKIPHTKNWKKPAIEIALLDKNYKLIREYKSLHALRGVYGTGHFAVCQTDNLKKGKALDFGKYIIVVADHFKSGDYELTIRTLNQQKQNKIKKEKIKKLKEKAILVIDEDLNIIEEHQGKMKDIAELKGFKLGGFKSRLSLTPQRLLNYVESKNRIDIYLNFPAYLYRKDYDKLKKKIEAYQTLNQMLNYN